MMTIGDQIYHSLRSFFRAFVLLGKYKLRWVYLLPFVVYLIILLTGLNLTNELHEMVMTWLEGFRSNSSDDSSFVSTLFTISSVLTWIILKIFLFIVFAILSGYLTLLILSPVLAYISERIEEEMKGVHYPFNVGKFMKDILRAVIVTLRNGAVQMAWTLVLLILGLIPVINIFSTIALFVISAYFYGFSFLDYSFERKGVKLKDSVKEARNMKWGAITLGSIFLVVNMVPYVGPLLSCFFVFHLVIAATLLVEEKHRPGELSQSSSVPRSD
jgi:CysZ protein